MTHATRPQSRSAWLHVRITEDERQRIEALYRPRGILPSARLRLLLQRDLDEIAQVGASEPPSAISTAA